MHFHAGFHPTGTGTYDLVVDDLTPSVEELTHLGDITEQTNAAFVDGELKAIENADSTQLWSFTLSEPRQVDFLLRHILNQETDFALLDAEGREIWESDDSTDAQGNARPFLHQPVPAGFYYIEINGKQLPEDDPYVMRYKTSTRLDDVNWHYELNDIADAEETTLSGQPMFGINGETDTYMFRLSGSESKVVSLRVGGLGRDADLEVYDEDDRLIASSREYGTRNETVEVVLPPSSEDKFYKAKVIMQEDGVTWYDFTYSLSDVIELSPTDDVQVVQQTTSPSQAGAHYYKIETSSASEKFFVRAPSGNVSLYLLDKKGALLMESDGPGRGFVFADPEDGETEYYIKVVPEGSGIPFELTYELTPSNDLGTITQGVQGSYRFLREGLDDGEVTYHKLSLASPGEISLAYEIDGSQCFDDIRVLDAEGNLVSSTIGLLAAGAHHIRVRAEELEAGDYYIVIDYNGEPHCDTLFGFYAGSGEVPVLSTEGIGTGTFTPWRSHIAATYLPTLDEGQNYVLDLDLPDGQEIPTLDILLVRGDMHEFVGSLDTELAGTDEARRVQFAIDSDASELQIIIAARNREALPTVNWTLTPDDYTADTLTRGELAVGGSLQGNLETDGDRDWIEVELEADREYRYDVDADWTTQWLFRGIHDSDGDLLQSAGQTFMPTEDGSYYFAVGASAGMTGHYTLTVEEDVL